MEFFLIWLVATIVVGVVAPTRGRSGPGWVLLSFLISPLFAIILIVLLPSRKASEHDQMLFDAMTPEQQRRVIEAREERARNAGTVTAPDGGPAWWHRVP
jgi:hypothetical protein